MSKTEDAPLDHTPWNLAVDEEAGELHIEHADSGDEYVFDDEGNLRVPGDGDVDGPLHEVRDALASALSGETSEHPQVSGEDCPISVDEKTGEVTVASPRKITLTAPDIDLNTTNKLDISARTLDVLASGELTVEGKSKAKVSSKANLQLTSNGQVGIESSALMVLKGSLIKLN